jgi:hypothetical protein
VGCGYNLRTLELSGICPECSSVVARSTTALPDPTITFVALALAAVAITFGPILSFNVFTHVASVSLLFAAAYLMRYRCDLAFTELGRISRRFWIAILLHAALAVGVLGVWIVEWGFGTAIEVYRSGPADSLPNLAPATLLAGGPLTGGFLPPVFAIGLAAASKIAFCMLGFGLIGRLPGRTPENHFRIIAGLLAAGTASVILAGSIGGGTEEAATSGSWLSMVLNVAGCVALGAGTIWLMLAAWGLALCVRKLALRTAYRQVSAAANPITSHAGGGGGGFSAVMMRFL